MALPYNLNDPNAVTASFIFIVEIVLFFLLILARMSAKRSDSSNLYKYVYTVTIVNICLILTWMIPAEFTFWIQVFKGQVDILTVLIYVLHVFFGSIAILLSLFLCLSFLKTFLKSKEKFLPLTKNMRFFMIVTFSSWVIAFLLGSIIFINRYLLKFL